MKAKPPSDNTIFAIVIFTVIIACFAYFNSPTHRHYNPSDKHQSSSKNGYAKTIVSMPKKIDPVADPKRTYSSQEKEKYAAERSDLAAQWATAKYTFVGLVMGGLGLLFIIMTLRESRNAAYFTEQALIETKTNSRRELRAYVHVVPYALNINSTGKVPTVIIRLFNKGLTPAINVTCDISAGLGRDVDLLTEDSFPVKLSIPPNSHEDIRWPFIDDDTGGGEWHAKIYFKTTFNDIFGNKRYLSIGVDVSESSFPTTDAILFQRNISSRPDVRHPFNNPEYREETVLPFVAYEDDLQQEAKEYAEANKTS